MNAELKEPCRDAGLFCLEEQREMLEIELFIVCACGSEDEVKKC